MMMKKILAFLCLLCLLAGAMPAGAVIFWKPCSTGTAQDGCCSGAKPTWQKVITGMRPNAFTGRRPISPERSSPGWKFAAGSWGTFSRPISTPASRKNDRERRFIPSFPFYFNDGVLEYPRNGVRFTDK